MMPVADKAKPLDLQRVRAAFPILGNQLNGRPLTYLDNAATTQKPRQVMDTIAHYYREYNSNVHRGVHQLSQEATRAYEDVRAHVQRFVHAADEAEIIFTRGTTEGINLVAQSWGGANLGPDDVVLITVMEHHSNIVPWQMVCAATGATLKAVPILDDGSLDMDAFHALLDDSVKLVAVGHISNALGTINPIQQITTAAHEKGALVFVDGAQGAPHMRIDVRTLGADFYAFSAHKTYGPTGVGVLYGRRDLLEAMHPWQGGGDMIRTVKIAGSTWADLPHKFEAGTPNIAGVIGLGAALDYMESLGLDAIQAHEDELLAYGTEVLGRIEGLRMIGTAAHKAGVLSFVYEGAHPHDVGTILDQEGIAIRTGHHCAQPVMERFGIPATARASLAVYNTMKEIDRLAAGLDKVREIFA
ncbi:MAG: cysteine desulfurase [bacterium]|nr:cysteine desulfurase [bacterium]